MSRDLLLLNAHQPIVPNLSALQKDVTYKTALSIQRSDGSGRSLLIRGQRKERWKIQAMNQGEINEAIDQGPSEAQ